ncbi:hypothetical protein RDWZM_003015 [Blomia tropicalis]|uniref:Histone deacetylase complex subunit SAP30 Sin3 binding domain-containing protein n=1 Tax=Blomia tropicalis TaxID=40697 RepID=A0A9Q0RSA3_BLOTA|nr:hypothetical protein RDWZM_003015 [Blomia tropicalis]
MGINSQQYSNGSGMSYPISANSYNVVNSSSNSTSNFSTAMSMNSSNSLQQLCCLVENGIKCDRASGNASYSNRIAKQVAQRKLRLQEDSRSSHRYICEHHKQMIQSIRTIGKKKKRKDDDDDELNDLHGNDSSNDISSHPLSLNTNSSHKSYSSSSMYDIDLHTLQVSTLRRYKRHFRLSTKPGLNKNQLAEECTKHFRATTVNEKDVINSFIYTIKSNGTN